MKFRGYSVKTAVSGKMDKFAAHIKKQLWAESEKNWAAHHGPRPGTVKEEAGRAGAASRGGPCATHVRRSSSSARSRGRSMARRLLPAMWNDGAVGKSSDEVRNGWIRRRGS